MYRKIPPVVVCGRAAPSAKPMRGEVSPLQANQSEWSIQHHSLAEAEGKFTTWEVPNGERIFKVPFSMQHLAKQHMDQGAYSQEA